jgi:hypothetical protein
MLTNLLTGKVDETFLIESSGLSNVIWVASQSKCACRTDDRRLYIGRKEDGRNRVFRNRYTLSLSAAEPGSRSREPMPRCRHGCPL